mmetsp:Transcript_8578/g.14266  ORF Transcript_8578/g.14266 Transcript_8578/m.14266 type:complete len:167 (-) Transcript_8578:206-706(-)|eukprot:CAMPEP_0119015026 /NCGR_PEP_ID=MMETSP1176-20130426/10517_1 /TAXON_ID=265551 /ORGANISM="Synedropsis recta cf, Strain CCMP1620" /LENGTH=166 /DNA_ID=CAMNT_0006968285 /DNA_START=80 /DNA_END=580 /DNA_ORIENTATION=-
MLAVSYFILLVVAVFRCECAAFTPSRGSILAIRRVTFHSVVGSTSSSTYAPATGHSISTLLRLRMKDGNKEEKDEPMTLAEIARIEEEASRKVMNRLLLPNRIGEAVTSMAWFFVGSAVLLQGFGYGYVINDNHMISIDTLENREFQVTMRKSMREAKTETPPRQE